MGKNEQPAQPTQPGPEQGDNVVPLPLERAPSAADVAFEAVRAAGDVPPPPMPGTRGEPRRSVAMPPRPTSMLPPEKKAAFEEQGYSDATETARGVHAAAIREVLQEPPPPAEIQPPTKPT